MRFDEVGTVRDVMEWLELHCVDPSDPLATGPAGGVGRRAGSDGTPLVDGFAALEYASLRELAPTTARAFLLDVADLVHRFPKLFRAVMALWIPVWQARKIAVACRSLSLAAALRVDAEIAAKAAGLPWSRLLTQLDAAIKRADPELAERQRLKAKQARYVALCRSEDGINTLIARADQGDLVMVYALVERLAEILVLEGNTELADARRATAFGLLAQPALVLQMLLRHADDRAHGETRNSTPADGTHADSTPAESAPADGTHADSTPRDSAPAGGESQAQAASEGRSGPEPTAEPVQDTLPDEDELLDEEPPVWTDEGYAEPPDSPDSPSDADPGSRWRRRPPPAPESSPFSPGWSSESGWSSEPGGSPESESSFESDGDGPDKAAPCPHCGGGDGSGLRLDLPGLTELLTEKGLRAARPRVVLNVSLTDQTLATGEGVVRVDHPDYGPMLASQLREFLVRHSCSISLRPVLDPDHLPAVDAYEIPRVVRDAVRLRHVASVFPWSSSTGTGMDLDHTNPYRWDGTPGQTGPRNLGPLARTEHNARTHGLWTVQAPHPGVFLWRSPHGYYFLCTNQGTQSLGPLPDPSQQRRE